MTKYKNASMLLYLHFLFITSTQIHEFKYIYVYMNKSNIYMNAKYLSIRVALQFCIFVSFYPWLHFLLHVFYKIKYIITIFDIVNDII